MSNSKTTPQKKMRGKVIKVSNLEKYLSGSVMETVRCLRKSGEGFTNSRSFKRISLRVKKMRSKRMFSFLNKLVKYFKIIYSVTLDMSYIYRYLNFLEKSILYKGYDRTAKIAKELGSYLLRIGVGHISQRVSFVACDKRSGFPRPLNIFKTFLKSYPYDFNKLKCLLTVIDLHRLYGEGSVIPDLAGIIDPGVLPRVQPSENTPGSYFQRLFIKTSDPFWLQAARGWKLLLRKEFPRDELIDRLSLVRSKSDYLHISSKRGPNGPCLGSIIPDFLGIEGSYCIDGESLLSKITDLSQIIGNGPLSSLIYKMEGVRESSDLLRFEKQCLTGRLSVKQEHSGKARIIAILDAFSQSVMKPISDYHFSWLNRQENDGSRDHNLVSQKIKELSSLPFSNENGLFSLDLTEATNRLSVDLQTEVISSQLGAEVSSLWNSIVSDRLFAYEDSTVKYTVGQPMGIYSSWTSLAITNHMLGRLAFWMTFNTLKCQTYPFYIIGDDFCCVGTSLAQKYTTILKGIGVTISESKGFTSETQIGLPFWDPTNNVAEIAKRVFINGEEVTMVRPKILLEFFGKPCDFNNGLASLSSKGILVDLGQLYDLSRLCFNPDLSLEYALNPIKPSIIMEDFYSSLGEDEVISNCDFTDLTNLRLNRIDLVADKISLLVKTKSEYKAYFRIALCKFVNNTVKPYFNKMRSYLDKTDMVPVDDIWYDIPEMPGFTLDDSGFMILNILKSYIYFGLSNQLDDIVDLFNKSDETISSIEVISLKLLSISEYGNLLSGKYTLPERSNGEIRLFSDISQMIRQTISLSDIKDSTILFKDVEHLLYNETTHKYNKDTGLSNSFGSTVNVNEKTSTFLQSKEGFLSTRSDDVKNAMLALELKFKNFYSPKDFSLDSKKISIEPKLMALSIEKKSNQLKLVRSDLIEFYKNQLGDIYPLGIPRPDNNRPRYPVIDFPI